MNPFDPARDYTADSDPHIADGADYRPAWPNMDNKDTDSFTEGATGQYNHPPDDDGRGSVPPPGPPPDPDPDRFTYPVPRQGGRL